MPYTHRQSLYAKYMLQKLGMIDDSIMEKYLAGLERVYGGYKYFPPNGQWYYSVSKCIDNIKEELELKKSKHEIEFKQTDEDVFITATDLANYAFCPVNYSIQKSFIIANPSNIEAMITGNFLHEKLRLIKNNINRGIFENNEYDDDLIYNNSILRFIYSSKVVYSGHKKKRIRFYFHKS